MRGAQLAEEVVLPRGRGGLGHGTGPEQVSHGILPAGRSHYLGIIQHSEWRAYQGLSLLTPQEPSCSGVPMGVATLLNILGRGKYFLIIPTHPPALYLLSTRGSPPL